MAQTKRSALRLNHDTQRRRGFTMTEHSADCSMVHSGIYDLIDVEDDATFANGVRFRTVMVEGTLEAPKIQGDSLIIDNGIVRCSGRIHVRRISGRGTLEVKGDIICESIEMTGSVNTDGNIRCSGDMNITGALRNVHHIIADNLSMHGVLHGNDIDGRVFFTQPLHSTMFSRFGMPDYQAQSRVTLIKASEVSACKLICRTIKADSASLREGSAVEHAICSTTLGTDTTSNVMLLKGACRRVHLRTA
ncbi:polymer-forming cytoskeletal protein [Bifidobacterium felsineum]|uniref:polymer-forming cytoskeletal protein n=1 Tax=Bifidobacterium felsineum TaxID=2045440 RepID=UPI0030B80DB5